MLSLAAPVTYVGVVQDISFLIYPFDFAFLYLVGALYTAGVALVSRKYLLMPVSDEARLPLIRYVIDSIRSFAGVRDLVILWFAYFFWFSTLSAMPNLSLYTKEVLRRSPKEFSGLIMALRFGFKSLGGFILGILTLRYGIRAPLITTILLVGGAISWAWLAPGYFYLLGFGWMGAGELGGAYFPNYIISISSMAAGVRNQALLGLATPAASFAPALHGVLTDRFGFPGSFTLGGATALLALCLVLRLPSRPGRFNGSASVKKKGT